MKVRSLLLGSIAAAGLSTGAYAADLGVLTSLDVCDALGISGLTIASSSNCLSITGGVSYTFTWGDYGTTLRAYSADNVGANPANNAPFGDVTVLSSNGDLDWDSTVSAWIQFVGAAASDFGTAKAVIGLEQIAHRRVRDLGDPTNGPDGTDGLHFNEAYVSIGDTTVIMAGMRKQGVQGSIANVGDDAAYGWLQTFNSQTVEGSGVLIEGTDDDSRFGGHAIQIVSDLGNGFSIGASLENLNSITPLQIRYNDDIDTPNVTPAGGGTVSGNNAGDGTDFAGTALGVINYKGDGVTAHLTAGAFGVLDGDVDAWFVHAGASGTFDMFKLRGAFGYEQDVGNDYIFNALVSAEATFDIFTLSAAFDTVMSDDADFDDPNYGAVISGKFAVTDTVSLNLAGRWTHNENHAAGAEDTYHVAAQLVAAVTETIKLTGEIGGYFNDGGFPVHTGGAVTSIYYGSLEAAWNPGGGFTASLKGEATSEEGYRATFKAAKSFQ